MVSNPRCVTLLLHGLCSTPEELLTVDKTLTGQGHLVKHMLIPGYSFDASIERQKALGFENWIDFVSKEIQGIKANGQSVNLIGLSAGVTVALGVALEMSQEIEQLILLSTPLIIDGWNIPIYYFLLPLALYTPLGGILEIQRIKPLRCQERAHQRVDRARTQSKTHFSSGSQCS